MTDIERASILKELIKRDFETVMGARSQFKTKSAHKALNNLLYILTRTRNAL